MAPTSDDTGGSDGDVGEPGQTDWLDLLSKDNRLAQSDQPEIIGSVRFVELGMHEESAGEVVDLAGLDVAEEVVFTDTDDHVAHPTVFPEITNARSFLLDSFA